MRTQLRSAGRLWQWIKKTALPYLGRKLRWVPPTLVYALIAWIAAALAVAIYSVTRSPWDPKEYNKPVEESIAHAYGEHVKVHPSEAFASVVISVRTIDPQGYAVGAVITIRFYGFRLVDANGEDAGASIDGTVDPPTANGSEAIVTTIATTQGATRVEAPISSLDKASGAVSVVATIPVTGFPQNFPSDYYDLRAVSWVQVPDGLALVANGSASAAIRTHTAFEIGSGLAYWRAEPGPAASVTSDERLHGVAGVRLFRPVRFTLYIFAVCTVPTALMALYFLLSLQGRVRTVPSHFELGVAVLAIISLRQIFVPDGVISQTTLDHWLGLSLVACVLMSAIIAIVEARVRKRATAAMAGAQSTPYGPAVLLPAQVSDRDEEQELTGHTHTPAPATDPA